MHGDLVGLRQSFPRNYSCLNLYTFIYETGGIELLMLEVVVAIASSVVMVNDTLAGADL